MIQFVSENGKTHDIKNCPFCGKEPHIVFFDEDMCIREFRDELTDYVGLRCNVCDLTMTEDYISEEDIITLIEKWNRRVIY